MIPVCNVNLSLSGCWKQPSTCTKEPRGKFSHKLYDIVNFYISNQLFIIKLAYPMLHPLAQSLTGRQKSP